MSENLLIDLCEPYLLDLIRFLAERMRRVDENLPEMASDGEYNLTNTVIAQLDDLDYVKKAEILAAAANHVLTTARRDAGV